MAKGDPKVMKFWPQVENEVRQWKFTPFEKNGKAVTAQVEEFIILAAPARPSPNAAAPVLRQDSKVAITLTRTMCYGPCPAYKVTISADRIIFEGHTFVVASGKHTARTDANEVRKLAELFLAAGFYSMRSSYSASITDFPTIVLSIAIDGNTKQVTDYDGSEVGMPAVVEGLELETDALAGTMRWVLGRQGLVQALKAENFKFHSFAAQVILKEAATRGQTGTVLELLHAGVPLKPLPAPPNETDRFEYTGWLTAASLHPETLEVLIQAGASKDDDRDKDLALASAIRTGNLVSVRALLAYGANPDADLSKSMVPVSFAFMRHNERGETSMLFYAAESDSPEMVREILRHHPRLEIRNDEGRTPLIIAATSTHARAECVRLLAEAGADVNTRDDQGNTALHKAFSPDVAQELLKLGADVNARNLQGETPIFTNTNMANIPVLIEHGADLTIRNNKGETVMDFASKTRQEALRKAMQKLNPQ